MDNIKEECKTQPLEVEELRVEWKRMWRDRFDDRVRAEGVANQNYSLLSVEKGTVIFATRDFKPLTFKGILEERGVSDVFRFVSPSRHEGGWRKFIKGNIHPKVRHREKRQTVERVDEGKKQQQPKKGGRGWLHV